jgi:hypothetical protein
MRRSSVSCVAVVLIAGVLGACGDQTNNPAGAEARNSVSGDRVEHWTVDKADYSLTFYPGFASRAVISSPFGGNAVELYRQTGHFDLPNGAPRPAEHEIALKGGRYGRDLSLTLRDPKHEVARLWVHLHDDEHVAGMGIPSTNVEVLEVDNWANTCPPNCRTELTSGTPSRRSMVDTHDHFVAPTFPAQARERSGYRVSVDPSFARRVEVLRGGEATELYRQESVYYLPSGFNEPAREHQIRFSGGAAQRDLLIQVRDPKHHVARVIVEFYAPSAPNAVRGRLNSVRPEDGETLDVHNTPITCPPNC